jgi:hypothetical protein
MWEHRRLTTLCDSTACFRNSFNFSTLPINKIVINSWMWSFYVWKPDTPSVIRIRGSFIHVTFHLNIDVQQNKDKERTVCSFRNFAVQLCHLSQRYTTYSIIAKKKLGLSVCTYRRTQLWVCHRVRSAFFHCLPSAQELRKEWTRRVPKCRQRELLLRNILSVFCT